VAWHDVIADFQKSFLKEILLLDQFLKFSFRLASQGVLFLNVDSPEHFSGTIDAMLQKLDKGE